MPSSPPHLQALLADLGPGCGPAELGSPLGLPRDSPWTPRAYQPVRQLLGLWSPQDFSLFFSCLSHCVLLPSLPSLPFLSREAQWRLGELALPKEKGNGGPADSRIPLCSPSAVPEIFNEPFQLWGSALLSLGPSVFPRTMCLPFCRKEVNRNIISMLDGKAMGGLQPQERLRVSGQGTQRREMGHLGHRKIQDISPSTATD